MSQMLPLLMMMTNGNNAAQKPDFESVMNNLNKSGGSPADFMGGMSGINPEMMRMVKLFGEMRNKDKKGGVPTDLLLELMGGGNPQFQQMKMLMDMFKDTNKTNSGSTVTTASAEPLPINELKPIKAIAPDSIHRSMEEYLKKQNG